MDLVRWSAPQRLFMKAMSLLFVFSAAIFWAAPSFAADTIQDQLNGTWSGSWTPEGGVRDSMTIELRYDDSGKLTGRFVSPISKNFTKATFNAKTSVLSLEAADGTSSKQYKLNAKIAGTEIKGAVAVDNQTGQIHLIKWSYVPRMTR